MIALPQILKDTQNILSLGSQAVAPLI